jgi:tRNA(fMet)-specific endonuclease VapC
MNASSQHNVSERLEQTPVSDIKIPSMVAAELLYGAEKSSKREYNLKIVNAFLSLYEIVHFDKKAAEYYAVVRAELEHKGQIIGSNDIVIAATTLANAGILVTHNVNEFSRINGLMLDDWT